MHGHTNVKMSNVYQTTIFGLQPEDGCIKSRNVWLIWSFHYF